MSESASQPVSSILGFHLNRLFSWVLFLICLIKERDRVCLFLSLYESTVFQKTCCGRCLDFIILFSQNNYSEIQP